MDEKMSDGRGSNDAFGLFVGTNQGMEEIEKRMRENVDALLERAYPNSHRDGNNASKNRDTISKGTTENCNENTTNDISAQENDAEIQKSSTDSNQFKRKPGRDRKDDSATINCPSCQKNTTRKQHMLNHIKKYHLNSHPPMKRPSNDEEALALENYLRSHPISWPKTEGKELCTVCDKYEWRMKKRHKLQDTHKANVKILEELEKHPNSGIKRVKLYRKTCPFGCGEKIKIEDFIRYHSIDRCVYKKSDRNGGKV